MECQEHEHEKDPTSKLQVHFWFVLSQAGDSSKQGLPLDPRLSENKQKSSNQCQVPEQELKVPENTVGDCLEDDHKEEDATRDIHLEPRQNHCHSPLVLDLMADHPEIAFFAPNCRIHGIGMNQGITVKENESGQVVDLPTFLTEWMTGDGRKSLHANDDINVENHSCPTHPF